MSEARQCRGTTRNGSPCKNETTKKSGLCGRCKGVAAGSNDTVTQAVDVDALTMDGEDSTSARQPVWHLVEPPYLASSEEVTSSDGSTTFRAVIERKWPKGDYRVELWDVTNGYQPGDQQHIADVGRAEDLDAAIAIADQELARLADTNT